MENQQIMLEAGKHGFVFEIFKKKEENNGKLLFYLYIHTYEVFLTG